MMCKLLLFTWQKVSQVTTCLPRMQLCTLTFYLELTKSVALDKLELHNLDKLVVFHEVIAVNNVIFPTLVVVK